MRTSMRKKYAEAADEFEDLLQHYLTVGWKKGFKPNPKFDPEFYLRIYPDVAEAGMEPLTHFLLQGRAEGRVPSAQDLTFEPYCSSFEIPHEPVPMRGPATAELKAIAFYLPQFHAIPEMMNGGEKDLLSGPMCRAGSPNFDGHYQPHVPSVLGVTTTCAIQVCCKNRQSWLRVTESTAFAFITIGLPGQSYWIFRYSKSLTRQI